MHFFIRYYLKEEYWMKTVDKSNEKGVNVKPFAYAISLVDCKWKMHILFWFWHK